jgi:hypothetical protein
MSDLMIGSRELALSKPRSFGGWSFFLPGLVFKGGVYKLI